MKKIIIGIIVAVVIIFILIVSVNLLSSNHKDIDTIKQAYIINNENVDEIIDIYEYYGDKTYYVVTYMSNNIKMLSVIDDEWNEYTNIEYNSLFKIEENDYIIGYKYDKLVYEVKEKKDDGFNYIYYDAISGEMINKIYLDN